ncbi:MAG TPA: PDZ domain-containing protein, partial [Thermoanaerobacterales bacterium]|nr:PDZ domain-containing protein [Thermoanaerobacterales bacterium]
MEKRLYGRHIIPLRKRTLNSALYGLIGGIVGSFLLIFVGVSISNVGIHFAWLLAIILMLIHPRFICFSYAGGILSLFSLIFGYPKIDVAGLMAIVAILHFIEGVLVYTNGYKQATPIFMENEEYGVVGGFSLQKFWPLPLMILLLVASEEIPTEIVNMPDWWPLIRPSLDTTGENFFYMMFPVAAGLGYGDISLTSLPKRKARISAINLGIFGTVLLILAVFASRLYIFKYIAAIFAPIAHELLIYFGRNIEKKNKPIFLSPEKGELVLDVYPD